MRHQRLRFGNVRKQMDGAQEMIGLQFTETDVALLHSDCLLQDFAAHEFRWGKGRLIKSFDILQNLVDSLPEVVEGFIRIVIELVRVFLVAMENTRD